MSTKLQGRKDDKGKPDFTAITHHPNALAKISAVLDYGAARYSTYGECSCTLKNKKLNTMLEPERLEKQSSVPSAQNLKHITEACAEITMSSSYVETILIMLKDSDKTLGIGRQEILKKLQSIKEYTESEIELVQNVEPVKKPRWENENTGSPRQNKTRSTAEDVRFAGAKMGGFVSTTTTEAERLETACATPATSVLDSLNEVITGSNEHSPTCNSRKVMADGRNNWSTLHNLEHRYLAAGLRHLFARARGERLDPESGLPHLAHLGCCILFLLEVGD